MKKAVRSKGRRRPTNLPVAACVVAMSFGRPALAAPSSAPATRVPPALLFSIAKSENKNQVQYAVRVNEQCVPLPGTPVFAYWRMLELGPNRVAPLLPRELRAYGIRRQTVDGQGNVRVVLNAVPSRAILVRSGRAPDGTCRASAQTTVAGSPAYLFNVYLKLKWLGIDYILLRGWSLDRTHVVTERLEPP
jgi:hypothetical protein